MKRQDGRELAVVNGYTFYCSKISKITKAWRCTRGAVCKARIITTNDDRASRRIMLAARLEHAHPPPAFFVSNGYCVKIPSRKRVYIRESDP